MTDRLEHLAKLHRLYQVALNNFTGGAFQSNDPQDAGLRSLEREQGNAFYRFMVAMEEAQIGVARAWPDIPNTWLLPVSAFGAPQSRWSKDGCEVANARADSDRIRRVCEEMEPELVKLMSRALRCFRGKTCVAEEKAPPEARRGRKKWLTGLLSRFLVLGRWSREVLPLVKVVAGLYGWPAVISLGNREG